MKLQYRISGSLGWITLENPPYNTLDHPVFADWTELKAFLATPELKAVVITGAGRHFCGGANLEALRVQAGDPATLAKAMDHGKTLLQTIAFAPVPMLALIRGSCLGGGLEIALACHFRFASANAMLGFPEAESGFMPGFGGAVFTSDRVSRQAIVDLMLSGRTVRGDEALSLGLVTRVLPTPELEGAATAFLHALTDERSPLLIRSVMESIHNGRRLPMGEALQRETELFGRVATQACEEHRTHSFMECVPLADVEADMARLIATCFTLGEAEEVASRRSATTAGFLAVKRALRRLFIEAGGPDALCERDFELTHLENGAPVLTAYPPGDYAPGFDPDTVHISISHTRAFAYGLAARQEQTDA